MTISEKILARAAGRESVKAGEIVWVNVDQAMMDDILGPRIEIAEKLKTLGDEVWDPERVTVISDHYTPPANVAQAEIVAFTRRWAAEHGIRHYYEFEGPCHQVMVEKGRVVPGTVMVGTDSHTCTYGALGAFATGIGSTEMLGVLAAGQIWLKVPQTMKIQFDGELTSGVMAKDAALKIIGAVGHRGATYQAMEFTGKVFDRMIMDERLCVANMAVEAGAKNGIIACDDITRAYLEELAGGYEAGRYEAGDDISRQTKAMELASDPDAVYRETYRFDGTTLEPVCACPHEVDQVTEIKNLSGTKIQQAYIGSCTGGRYHDLKMAARLLKGRKIARGIRLLVSPASREVWERCSRDGILTSLSEAGAVILPASCGACLGVHSGVIGAGETCISSTNRNFIGRMGSKESFVYLASPLSVAASAVTGRLTDPREFLKEVE